MLSCDIAQFFRDRKLLYLRPKEVSFDSKGFLEKEGIVLHEQIIYETSCVVYSREEKPVKDAIIIFVSMLDEQQRRLFAGLEALRLGHGGDLRIAELLGLHPQTVAKGRSELQEHDVRIGRIRRAGEGRKQLGKKPRR